MLDTLVHFSPIQLANAVVLGPLEEESIDP